ncbi:MAG: CHASE domain-containing protein [Dechloromonas sp.]|nr:CHASE domain-containing protein [Dechloromonas sp.]
MPDQDRPPPVGNTPQQRLRPWLRLLPAVVLVAGLGITWLLTEQLQRKSLQAERLELEIRTDEILGGLERRLAANGEILRGVAGLFSSSDTVDRDEFRTYVETLELPLYFPGIQAIGYVSLVPGRQRSAFIDAHRHDFPEFGIFPPGERDRYAPVTFVEPMDQRNMRVIGFDMMTEPVRFTAAERARDEGVAIITDKLTLRQESGPDVQAGIICFVPVYRAGLPLQGPEQRRAALVGWAYAALRVGDLVNAYLANEYAEMSKRVRIRLFADWSVAPAGLMFDSHPELDPEAAQPLTRLVAVDGRRWTLQLTPLAPLTGKRSASDGDRIVAIAGTLLSLLLAFGIRASGRHKERVEAALAETQAANRRLADREAWLRGIYDTASVGIFLMRPDGRIVEANDRFARLFGLDPAKAVGSSYFSLMPAGEIIATRERMAGLIEGTLPEAAIDRLYWRDDHSVFWGHTQARALYGARGDLLGIVGVVEDISVRKRMEEELRQHHDELERLVEERSAELRASEGKYRALVEQSLAGVFICQHGRLTYANPALARIYGYASPADMIGRLGLGDLARADEQPRLFGALDGLSEAVDREVRLDFSGLRRDGHPLELELQVRGFTYQRAPAIIGILLDVSERKAAEAAQALALETAEYLSRLKSEFINNVSHELRTPLNGILGLARIGQRGRDPARAPELFTGIVESGEKLLAIVQDVLDFSDLQQGQLQIDAQPCDLAALLDRHADTARRLALARQVEFAEQRDPGLPERCTLDARRVGQVLDNLLSNAVKFTPPGGRVALHSERRPDGLRFVVEDTGVGIAPEQQAHLFHPFEQGDGSTTRRFGGTGLGLAICHRLAEAMGASLAVDSTPGHGSRFTFVIPLAPETTR